MQDARRWSKRGGEREREERGKEEEGGEILGRITCVLPASGEQLLGIDSGLLILYP